MLNNRWPECVGKISDPVAINTVIQPGVHHQVKLRGYLNSLARGPDLKERPFFCYIGF